MVQAPREKLFKNALNNIESLMFDSVLFSPFAGLKESLWIAQQIVIASRPKNSTKKVHDMLLLVCESEIQNETRFQRAICTRCICLFAAPLSCPETGFVARVRFCDLKHRERTIVWSSFEV